MSIIANLSAKPDFDICIDDAVHELPEFKEIPPQHKAKASVKAAAAAAALPTTSAELYDAVGFAPLAPVAAHKLGISTEEYNELERKLSKPKQWRPPAQRADAVERDMWRSAPGPTEFRWKPILETLPKDEKKNTGEQLQDIILRNPQGHEVFLDNIRPYYDIDIPNLPGKTKADTKAYRAKWKEALCNTHAAIRAIWPLCTIHTFSSSGRTSEDTYKVSFHFIVSGAGYYKAGKGIPMIDVEGFDTQAYKEEGKRQCLRLPYAEAGKSGGKFPRFKQYVKIADDGPHATDLDDVCEEMADALQYWQYENWLPSFNKGEKLQHVEDDRYAEDYKHARTKERRWNDKKSGMPILESLLAIIPNTAETDWGTWQAIIWGAKHEACLSDGYEFGYDAVQAWSAKSPKHNEQETDNMWRAGREDHSGSYTIGTLHYYAKLHNKAEYYAWVKSITNAKKKSTGFNRKDPYCWYDFANQYENSHWLSKDEMIKAVMADAPRVIAYIRVSGGTYVQKINCTDQVYKWIENLRKEDFKLSYDEVTITPAKLNKKGEETKPATEKTTRKIVKLSSFLDDHLFKFAYSGCDFSQEPNERLFNTYDGMTASLLPDHDPEILNPLFKFLFEVVCNEDKEVYDYFINMLACSMQKPNEPVGIATVLHGIQGTGKDTLLTFLCDYVFGRHLYCPLSGIADATKNFNTSQQGKKLFHINEVSSTREGFFVNFDKMKEIITKPTRTVEPKGKDCFEVRAADLWFFTTNNIYSLYIEESDRRYLVVTMNPKYANDREYFEQLRQDIMSEEVGSHFYTYLMSYAANHLLLRHIPQTELRTTLQETSMSNSRRFAKYISELVPQDRPHDWPEDSKEPFNTTDPIYISHVSAKLSSANAYAKYREWCANNGENATTAWKFGREFTTCYTKTKSNGIIYYDTTPRIKQ